MPQIFQVLRCFKCLVFQIHQCKKSNKWQCKLCGEKQSVKRHYGIGTGKDCRMHVQKLNMLRGNNENTDINLSDSKNCDVQDVAMIGEDNVLTNEIQSNVVKNSKWDSYVDKTEELLEINNEPMYLDNKEVALEIPRKRKGPTTQMHKKVFTNNKKSFSKIEIGDYLRKDSIELAGKKTLNNNPKNDLVAADINNKVMTQKNKPSITGNSNWKTYVSDCEEIFEYDESKYHVHHREVLESPPKRMCITTKINKNIPMKNEKGLFNIESYQSNNLNKHAKRNITETCVDTKIEKQAVMKSLKEKEVNTNSKWCKYIGSDEDIQETLSPRVENPVDNAQQSLFSLCDDNDLDTILIV